LEVPRDREGEFVTELFERYKRMTGDVEEAVLEMYLSGISVRKIAGVTDALSRVRIGKDAVSRIASRLEEEQKAWRERPLEEKAYPYLYLDATYLKVRWGASVTNLALLACVGVDEGGFREVLTVEVASSEKGAAYTSLVRGLIDRGLRGVELYEKRFPKAISVFEAGIGDAMAYLSYPGSHHARIRTTNMLERLFKEVKRRTRVVGVFPNERSASTLATEIALRSSEEWALKRYLAMDSLEAVGKLNPQHSRH
jgi:transposase-like protein